MALRTFRAQTQVVNNLGLTFILSFSGVERKSESWLVIVIPSIVSNYLHGSLALGCHSLGLPFAMAKGDGREIWAPECHDASGQSWYVCTMLARRTPSLNPLVTDHPLGSHATCSSILSQHTNKSVLTVLPWFAESPLYGRIAQISLENALALRNVECQASTIRLGMSGLSA